MTSLNGNIFRVTGHLCGEFTGPGEFPPQRPVTRSFDVFFDLRLNRQSWGWWFETLSRPLWRHRNVTGTNVDQGITKTEIGTQYVANQTDCMVDSDAGLGSYGCLVQSAIVLHNPSHTHTSYAMSRRRHHMQGSLGRGHDDVIKWKHFPRYWPFVPPVSGEFPTQRPVTRSFDIFFVLRLNKRLSKHSWGWWFETLSCPLWRHCNGPSL